MTDLSGQSRDQLRRKQEMVWNALPQLDIKSVVVEFSGSGDSGQIDDCYPAHSTDHAAFGTKTLAFDSGQPFVLLRDVIIELSDEILRNDEIPVWCNNYGGFGVLEWTVAHIDREGTYRADQISVTVNVAVVDYDTSNIEYDRFGNRTEAV